MVTKSSTLVLSEFKFSPCKTNSNRTFSYIQNPSPGKLYPAFNSIFPPLCPSSCYLCRRCWGEHHFLCGECRWCWGCIGVRRRSRTIFSKMAATQHICIRQAHSTAVFGRRWSGHASMCCWKDKLCCPHFGRVRCGRSGTLFWRDL
jgi:hypothetical protein